MTGLVRAAAEVVEARGIVGVGLAGLTIPASHQFCSCQNVLILRQLSLPPPID